MTGPRCIPRPGERPVALVLQGGGALGAYQAGAYETLTARGYMPTWVAGISIGAINAALIAGNPPAGRGEALRAFWHLISDRPCTLPVDGWSGARALHDATSAFGTIAYGVRGFFKPRPLDWWGAAFGVAGAVSVYDTAPLKETLESLIDFERLNSGETRLSVGAVDIRTGNFEYFDTAERRVGPEHLMASGALPPGFPPVAIGDGLYWDGGLVSNTPLSDIDDKRGRDPLTVFQVDLFSARGPAPTSLTEVQARDKDIRYSSRTRAITDRVRETEAARAAIHRLLGKLPADLLADPDIAPLCAFAAPRPMTLVHLIYRSKTSNGWAKDYEFSRATMLDHWAAGARDAALALDHAHNINPDDLDDAVDVYDVA